jgi:TetR/AcrR family transcriptional repressor of nem operon
MGRTSNARERLLAVAFDLIHESSYGSVSVEHICRRAKVNKGSFYYFFKTKTDLVVAAYEEHWLLKEPDYERIFSKQNKPLHRLALWCEYVRGVQKERRAKYGHACGCPYTSVGGELATRDPKIQRETQDLMERHVRYLVGAIEGRTGPFANDRPLAARQNLQRFESAAAHRSGGFRHHRSHSTVIKKAGIPKRPGRVVPT